VGGHVKPTYHPGIEPLFGLFEPIARTREAVESWMTIAALGPSDFLLEMSAQMDVQIVRTTVC
jgi:hypothetical protein